MAIQFSTEAMRAMGFEPLTEGHSIVAKFSSVTVFEVRGITLDHQTTKIVRGNAAGVDYGIAVSAGLNKACEAIVADKYADAEDEWKQEHECVGPFALVTIGPTLDFTCSTGWSKEEQDGSLTTFDSFPGLRDDLKSRESRALPRILSALACVFNDEGRHASFRRLDRASAGKTATGQIVRDLRIEFKGEGYVSQNLSAESLEEKLLKSVALATSINPKVSRLFSLGLNEKDEFKKFMYFFLTLEVETHAVFGRIDHAQSLATLLGGAPTSRPSTADLLKRQADQFRNLFDRFVWCATFVWSGLREEDVEQFKALKKARDDIAHGTISEPPGGYARLAEQLAHKILWQCR